MLPWSTDVDTKVLKAAPKTDTIYMIDSTQYILRCSLGRAVGVERTLPGYSRGDVESVEAIPQANKNIPGLNYASAQKLLGKTRVSTWK